jgi:hypothetical protein
LIGFINNGRFPVVYNIPKKIIVYIFMFCLFVFAFLYFAMIWFVLVWCILAAILNPTKFLPYAAGSITLVSTVLLKYRSYKGKYENIKRKLGTIIDSSFNIIVGESIQKLKRLATN